MRNRLFLCYSGKYGVEIGIVGGFYCQMGIRNSPQAEVLQGKFDGRVGLQGHAGVQAVDVEPCHHWFFGIVVCLFLDDGGEGADFRRGHSDGGGFV